MESLRERQQLSCLPDRWAICSRSTIVKFDLFNPARNFAGKLHLHLAALPGALGRSGNKFTWNTSSDTRWAGGWSRLQRFEEPALRTNRKTAKSAEIRLGVFGLLVGSALSTSYGQNPLDNAGLN